MRKALLLCPILACAAPVPPVAAPSQQDLAEARALQHAQEKIQAYKDDQAQQESTQDYLKAERASEDQVVAQHQTHEAQSFRDWCAQDRDQRRADRTSAEQAYREALKANETLLTYRAKHCKAYVYVANGLINGRTLWTCERPDAPPELRPGSGWEEPRNEYPDEERRKDERCSGVDNGDQVPGHP